MGDLWVISGESGLTGHYVFQVQDHEPLNSEIRAVEKAFFSAKPGCCPTHGRAHVHFPTGWSGFEITRLHESSRGVWTIDLWDTE